MNKLSIFLLLFLSVAYSVQSSNTNYARTTDRIWLDSNEMHQGEYSWKMMKVSDVKASAEEVSSLGYNTSDWLSAIVPGTVLNSLVYNKKYPEPYYGLNNKIESNKIPDISKVGREFYTYWFRTDFIVPADYKGKVIWLQLDGINYRAEVWVNGHLLSNISGMFIQDYVDITEFARVGETNALAVKVYPVDMSGTVKQKQWGAVGEFHNGGDGNIGLNTTMLMSVGWDFTFLDGIRDRNTGIWKSISLYATDKAAIRNPFIRSELAKPGYDKAEETVSVEVINPTTGSVKCVVAGEITGENIRFSKRDKPFSWRNS